MPLPPDSIGEGIMLLDCYNSVLCLTQKGLRGWLRGTVVERRSSAGVLSLSCARPVADG